VAGSHHSIILIRLSWFGYPGTRPSRRKAPVPLTMPKIPAVITRFVRFRASSRQWRDFL